MDFAFSSAAKFHNVPVLSEFYSVKIIPRTQIKMINSYITRSLSNIVPTDTTKNKKQFSKKSLQPFYHT